MKSLESKLYAIRINRDIVEIRKGLNLKKKVCRFKRKGRVVLSQTLFEGGKVLGYMKFRSYLDYAYDYLDEGVAMEISSAMWMRLRRHKL